MKRSYLLVLIPLILGFLLSSSMILAGDFFYLADQARDYLLAKDIIYNNHLTLIGTHSGLGGFFHGPLWLYMLVPVYVIGGGNPIIFAYFYIILALVTVLVGFVVGKKLYNTWIGLLIALILSISPSIWEYVPNTIGINVVPLVYLGIFYFLIRFIRGNDNALIFAAFFVGLTLQFETAAALVLIPVFALTVLIFRFNVVKNLKILGFSILSFLVSISTFILFDLKHQFLMTKSLSQLFSSKPEKGYLEFSERLVSHINSFKGLLASVNFSDNTFLFALLLIILSIGYFAILKGNKKKGESMHKEYLVLLFIPVVMFLIFLKYPYPIYHDYVLGLTIPLALLVGLSVKIIWKFTFGKALVVLFIASNLLFAGIHVFDTYFHYEPDKTSGSYTNQRVVVDWIVQDAGESQAGYFVYDPTTYTYGMDYLVDWKKSQSGVSLESKKHKTTYLVMYPPLSGDEQAHDFWKKNVIKTRGSVVGRKEFTGGIVVEKLQIDEKEEAEDPNYHQSLIFR